MIPKGALMLAAGLAATFASPAAACSFSWAPGHSPDEIKARDDVRLVKGIFRFEVGRGDVREDGMLDRGTIYGHLETERGTGWKTVQPFDQFSVDCAAYLRPTADAKGSFWISRRKTGGRYELLLWEGTYLAQQGSEAGRVH